MSVNILLIEAAKSGSMRDIKSCLAQADCDPMAKDDEGNTALMWAVRRGEEDYARLLLSKSNVLAKNKSGGSALMYAVIAGNETCVKLILPQIDFLTHENEGRSASEMAMKLGDVALADMIEAYVLSQKEAAMLSADISSGPASRTPAIRM